MNAGAIRVLPQSDTARRIGSLAIRSLHAELALHPKPGLVSPHDNGSHSDMDASAFLRSMASLRGYFVAVASAGARGAPFRELRLLGVRAEERMLEATGGVNTHRGAIFALGLLAAAAGAVLAEGSKATDARVRDVLGRWRADLLAFAIDPAAPVSHGRSVAGRFGAKGARGEAIGGFPSVFETGLPALRFALSRTSDAASAQVHTLFTLLACVGDTNVIYRGGPDALAFLQREARAFLTAGSVFAADWRDRAERLHRECRARRISPGGCADLFSACWFVHQLQADA
jgi:triphosphoribosyl-dephospho-CoA synthase